MKRILFFLFFLCLPLIPFADELTEKSITLKEAIQLALKQNPEILMAEGKLKIAEGEFLKAQAATNPQLAFHAFGLASDTAAMLDTAASVSPMGWIMSNKGGELGGNFSFAFPLYTGGSLGEMARSASLEKASQKEKLSAVQLDVVLKTKLSYYAVLEAKGNVETAQADLRQSEEDNKRAEELLNAGTAPHYYLFRGQAKLAKSRQNLLQAENDLRLRKIELAVTLGGSPSDIFSPSDSLSEEVRVLDSPDNLLKTAHDNRPDLKAAESEIESMAAEVRAAEGSSKPQVYFFTRYDRFSNSPGSFNGINVGIHASLPIFDGGERKGMVEEANGKLQTASGEFKMLDLQIRDQVLQAYFGLETASKELEAAKEEVKSTEENLRVVKLRFQNGKGIQLEVLDGEQALTEARYHLTQALYNVNASFASLLWAQGML